jgi:hypothetical protein
MNYYPNQRKIPTIYDVPPTGVWKVQGQVTGDASGGSEIIDVLCDIALLTKRIISLEQVQVRGVNLVNTEYFLHVCHLLGTGLFDQVTMQYGIQSGATGGGARPAGAIKLPDMLSWGYPIQLVTANTNIVMLEALIANVLNAVLSMQAWGYWWDTSEPALMR